MNPMSPRFAPFLWLLPLLTAFAPAQDAAAPAVEVITEARVREVVSFLASDELQGRDTPSPGLEQAATFLAEAFAKAGLVQAVDGSWFHAYTLPGVRQEQAGLEVKVRRVDGDKVAERTLEAGAQVRLLRSGELSATEWQDATLAVHGDPRTDRMLLGGGARRPVLLEIDESEAVWQQAASPRDSLGGPRQGARPVLLLKRGSLPPGDPDKGAWQVLGTVPKPTPMEVPLRNVIGVLRGRELPDEYVIVSAHYDHVGVGAAVGGDAIYNGADDDASGTTAVVLLAEALAKGPAPRRSIAFVCFSAEEKGLRGSRAFAAAPPFPLEQAVVNVNIEMIGRPQEGKRHHAWITGVEYSDFPAIAGPALERGGVTLTGFEMARNLFLASDNASLAAHGVVAHSISAGSLHQDYHRPSDEVGKLDVEHMTVVIRGLREAVLEFANRPGRPAWNEAGRAAIERLRSRRR